MFKYAGKIGIGIGAALVVVIAASPLISQKSVAIAADKLADNGFDLVPPAVDDLQLTALPKERSANGNALLVIDYAKAQQLPDSIPLSIGDKTFAAQRDKELPDRYSVQFDFDFDGFVKEQAERQQLSTKEPAVTVFDGREAVGTRPLAFIDPARLREQIASNTAIRIPRDIFLGPVTPVNPANSLFITARPVVEDPTRTFDMCTNQGNPNGAWTFKTLMTNMANQPLTGVIPADFVENWMSTWATNATVNTFPIPKRPNVITRVLNQWPRDLNGRLNLDKSPLRLQAIVPRLDLRSNATYGGGQAGEGRFVFAMVAPRPGGGCDNVEAMVILEYGLPFRGCPAIRSYAQQWGALSGMVLGSSAYNSALQNITNQFTAANAMPSKPNGSAINQIRSNEFIGPPTPTQWELREFNVMTNHQLRLVSAKQTPHSSRNNTALLAQYINQFETQILAETYVVPTTYTGQPFLTGSAFNTTGVWRANGINSNLARSRFSKNTCDGCHGRETTTRFLHVVPRLPGAESALSRFLIGDPPGTLQNPTLHNVTDPVDLITNRQYGDLVRRQSDLTALQSSACLSSAVLSDLHAFHSTALPLATD